MNKRFSLSGQLALQTSTKSRIFKVLQLLYLKAKNCDQYAGSTSYGLIHRMLECGGSWRDEHHTTECCLCAIG
jgi:hypothetical protein